MARTVTYSVVPRINPRSKEDPAKYYAQAQARGDVSLREIADRIQSSSTVHKTDVYAVLVALEDVVKEALQNGEIVRLGELCTLQLGINSKGSITEEEYNDSLIKKAHINFRPGVVLSSMLTNLAYTKVPKKPLPIKKEEENNDGFEQ